MFLRCYFRYFRSLLCLSRRSGGPTRGYTDPVLPAGPRGRASKAMRAPSANTLPEPSRGRTRVRVSGGQVRTSLNLDRFGQVPREPGPNPSDPVHEATIYGPGSRRVRTVQTGAGPRADGDSGQVQARLDTLSCHLASMHSASRIKRKIRVREI